MKVRSSQNSYEVVFCDAADALPEPGQQTWLITDTNVGGAYSSLLAGFENVLQVEPGEESKSLQVYGRCLSWLASRGAKRGCTVVAFGGGVVGDLAGFVAATYMRGVKLVMVPTSLLAMVDSSVGGKVAVDLDEGKNLVGSFWPPSEVRVAAQFLRTLPAREFACGAAEVWKTAAILDSKLFDTLEKETLTLNGRTEGVIERCIELKAGVVEQDEFETTGLRAILNFGHTVGHALETVLGFGAWTHGEAISVGMCVEAALGERLGLTEQGTSERLTRVLGIQGLPTVLPLGIEHEKLINLMKNDKKATAEGMSFSLLTRIGECKLASGVPEALVRQVLARA